MFLGWIGDQYHGPGGGRVMAGVPRARSSEISKSLSLADMDRYNAVTDIRLDWRSDRVSCDDMVFCRATG